MTALTWDSVGERLYETGVDHGVLYLPDAGGAYTSGVAWNGLTTVTESPSGAEANPQYADNMKYLNLLSNEDFGCTIEAYTYPDEFGQCDGTLEPSVGVRIGQQDRRLFGFSYRTKVGNDLDGSSHGYKLHLVYGALAAPSEKAYTTVNDSPEGLKFSWTVTTTPVEVGTIDSVTYKPTSLIVVDSTKVTSGSLQALETILYGTVGVDPMLPTPAAVVALFAGTITEATPTAPTFAANTITIPTVTGVTYYIDGVAVSGDVDITANTVVTAWPNAGYMFPAVTDNDWLFTYA
jgi:hypothetical protein